jgi:hypothetical protein
MGLFDFFNFKRNGVSVNEPTEDQFIDNSEPNDAVGNGVESLQHTLQAIYDYATIDFEQRGYQDALINPDSSYKLENISLLIEDLNIKIRQAKNHYTTLLKKLDFHITSRKDAGLIDTVNELETKKSITVQHHEEVLKIENETVQEKGLVARLKLSYNRGFNRGLVSISTELLTTQL